MATSFGSPDGTPISAADFITRLYGELPALFKSEDELRTLWRDPSTCRDLLAGLAERGFGAEQLHEIERLIDAEHSDLYDVLAYIASARSPLTREERATAGRPLIIAGRDARLQAFLDFVLSHYVREGVAELDTTKLPHLLDLRYGAVTDAVIELGPMPIIRSAFADFQQHLYP